VARDVSVPSYEVETAPIRSGHRAVAVAVVAALLIVAAAVAGAVVPRPAAPAAAAARDPERSPGVAAIARSAVMCDGLPDAECLAAVSAARRALDDVDVTPDNARAWPTLLCRDDLDCPRPLLAASQPVGSVVLTFAHIGVVWVNVFRIPEPNRLNENREVVAGRVVRWFPDDS
jgi:hypothetical protein